jgi:hypothetical protein
MPGGFGSPHESNHQLALAMPVDAGVEEFKASWVVVRVDGRGWPIEPRGFPDNKSKEKAMRRMATISIHHRLLLVMLP